MLTVVTPTMPYNISWLQEIGDGLSAQNINIEWLVIGHNKIESDLHYPFKFIQTSKKYCGERRNIGLNEATKEFIAFLD
jgi:hypothetical protein